MKPILNSDIRDVKARMKNNYPSTHKFSKRINAGKRAYFFDVKATKSNDHYIVITESKQSSDSEGNVFLRHKLFLYKEDFEKFSKALEESISVAVEFQTRFDSGDGTHEEIS